MTPWWSNTNDAQRRVTMRNSAWQSTAMNNRGDEATINPHMDVGARHDAVMTQCTTEHGDDAVMTRCEDDAQHNASSRHSDNRTCWTMKSGNEAEHRTGWTGNVMRNST